MENYSDQISQGIIGGKLLHANKIRVKQTLNKLKSLGITLKYLLMLLKFVGFH